MLINVKMPTISGILTFMSMINFMFSRVEYEKSFITSGLVYAEISIGSKFSSKRLYVEHLCEIILIGGAIF